MTLRQVFSLLAVVSFSIVMTNALASSSPQQQRPVVIVSGAGGQTGQSLFRKLLKDDDFNPIGLVRSEESKKSLIESGGIDDESTVRVVDVTDSNAIKIALEPYKDDITAFCICTSAKPAPTEEVNPETGRPIFSFPNGEPEIVDWVGQKNQIDICQPGTHVVLCSTMGGTNPDHPLNTLGRTFSEDGKSSTGGNIVKWKRKSEVYLMGQEHLKYTIVHPGGLVNESGGLRELVVGVDDDMGQTESRTVPREDVAQVMLEALRYPNVYAGRSFDLRAAPPAAGGDDSCVDTNFKTLLDSLQGKNCDYNLGETM